MSYLVLLFLLYDQPFIFFLQNIQKFSHSNNSDLIMLSSLGILGRVAMTIMLLLFYVYFFQAIQLYLQPMQEALLIQRCSLRSVCCFHCYYSRQATLASELQKSSVVTRVLSSLNFEFWPLLIGILSTLQLQEGHLIAEASLLI